MTKIKIALASALVLSFASSAFAGDAQLYMDERDAYWKTPQVESGIHAYAQAQVHAPMRVLPFSKAEQREFNRVPIDEVSSH